jgi:hypothetical protein
VYRYSMHRLHPALAAIPNACFYGGELSDGCGAADRAAMLSVDRVARSLTTVVGAGGEVKGLEAGAYTRPLLSST